MASNVILFCLFAIIIVCAYNIGTTLYKYHVGQKTYGDIAKLVKADEDFFTGDIDFDALKNVNSDVIGWIHLYDTPINYPVVQTTNNDTYLTKMFNGEYGGGGTIFADYRNQNPFKDFGTILYGHHMRDGSMFKALKKFKDEEYAKNHSTFELVTPEGKYRLEVVAFLNIPADSDVYNIVSATEASEKEEYTSILKNNAVYTMGSGFTSSDTLVLLSTCAYEYDAARYVVVGKKVAW